MHWLICNETYHCSTRKPTSVELSAVYNPWIWAPFKKKKKKDFWFFQEDVTAKKSQLKLSRGKFRLSVPDDEMIRASCLAAYADGSFAEELDNVKRTQSPRIEMYYVVL